MRRIRLSTGKYALVDADLYETLKALSPWSCSERGYAIRRAGGRNGGPIVFMHKLVLKLSGKRVRRQVDHWDRNTLNNQRRNLRPATNAQNGRNRGPNKNSTSGFKGVTRNRRQKVWTAQITVHGRNVFLGNFIRAVDAARAYDAGARRLHGKFAWTNFKGQRS